MVGKAVVLNALSTIELGDMARTRTRIRFYIRRDETWEKWIEGTHLRIQLVCLPESLNINNEDPLVGEDKSVSSGLVCKDNLLVGLKETRFSVKLRIERGGVDGHCILTNEV